MALRAGLGIGVEPRETCHEEADTCQREALSPVESQLICELYTSVHGKPSAYVALRDISRFSVPRHLILWLAELRHPLFMAVQKKNGRRNRPSFSTS